MACWTQLNTCELLYVTKLSNIAFNIDHCCEFIFTNFMPFKIRL